MNKQCVNIRWLAQQDYLSCWQAMRQFTDQRDMHTPDEIWLLEHAPVFTQGQNGKAEHILNAGDIPVVQTDRGGQVTYHGPGQLTIYLLVDLKRKKWVIREFVSLLERSIIEFLNTHRIESYAKKEAPGVYVKVQNIEKKLCSIGLRIRKGCSYHGIAFNVDLELEPFSRINPCGFSELKMTHLSELCGSPQNIRQVGEQLINYLQKNLGYTTANYI